MENKNLMTAKVTCSNDIIEAGYRLTLMETRLLQACIAQIDSTKELLVTDRFELSAKDFAKLYKISEESAYDELKEVSKQLFSRHIVINNPDPEQPKIKQTRTQWITSIDYLPDEGKIYLFFAPKILPYLSQLKGKFTQYELKNIGNMKSTYGIRLYLLMMQWKTTGTRTIEIDGLKKQLELDDSYDRMNNFKARVIEPAVNDMNKNSDYTVGWEQRKTGRKVTHLIFTFTEKQPLTPKKPKRVNKPKEKMYYGVPKSEIDKLARTGESYEDAAMRINREKAAKKTPAPITTPTPTSIPAPPSIGDYIEKIGIKKPKPAAPIVSPSSAAEKEAHRISVINLCISKNKAAYLEEFTSKGFVTIHGISGVIIETDLKMAGLFD
jgi:plasmid replication initiation protein